MTGINIKIADFTIPFDEIYNFGINPVRYIFTPDGAGMFYVEVVDKAFDWPAGLGSSFEIIEDKATIYRGFVYSQERYFDGKSIRKGFKIYDNLLGLCFVDAVNHFGVPNIRLKDIFISDLIKYLIDNARERLLGLGLVSGEGYIKADLDGIFQEKVGYFKLVNESLFSGINKAMDASLEKCIFWLDHRDKVLRFSRRESLKVYDLSYAEGIRLIDYRHKTDLASLASSVEIRSDPAVEIAYSAAVKAWNEDLEGLWSIRYPLYASPDSSEEDELAFVFRRFSFAHIGDLLEDEPIELLEKVPTDDGGFTYKLIDTLPADKENKVLIARYPVVASVGPGRADRKNIRLEGKGELPEVYIRYRRVSSSPDFGISFARYPESGFSGTVFRQAAIENNRIFYVKDRSRIKDEEASLLFKRYCGIKGSLELTFKAVNLFPWMFRPSLIRLVSLGDQVVSTGSLGFVKRVELDFNRSTTTLSLELLG